MRTISPFSSCASLKDRSRGRHLSSKEHCGCMPRVSGSELLPSTVMLEARQTDARSVIARKICVRSRNRPSSTRRPVLAVRALEPTVPVSRRPSPQTSAIAVGRAIVAVTGGRGLEVDGDVGVDDVVTGCEASVGVAVTAAGDDAVPQPTSNRPATRRNRATEERPQLMP